MTALRWQLRRRPQGEVTAEDLELVDYEPLAVGPDQVRVRNVYLSLDPTHRLWMSDREQYMEPVAIGAVMRGSTVGTVVASRSARHNVGDLVSVGLAGWETDTTVDARLARPVARVPGVPLSAALSVLGSTGLTAWVGVTRIAEVRAGETVVVSAAAGAVGSVAAQIAKQRGARVIGIAGSRAKCDWLTGELGLDGAIDYRSDDVGAALDRLCPDGIDVDFENVGGPVMQAVYARMATGGRMALCGLISSYAEDGPVPGPMDFSKVLMRRLSIRGFVIIDHLRDTPDALAELVPWVTSGAVHWRDHVVPGLENALDALGLLFSGQHDGKVMVAVSPEPEEGAGS